MTGSGTPGQPGPGIRQAMTPEEIYQHALKTIPAETLGQMPEDAAQPWITVSPDTLIEVLALFRDDPALAFDCLDCLTVTDMLDEGQLELVYHLYSYTHQHLFVIKARIGRDDPEAPSVTGLWPAADWYEREQYDMFGVRFTGHPNMTRLFLPDEWVGHPMRLDWEEGETALGISTSRPDPLVKKETVTGGGDDA
jgi:NADH-quinone oxidoreductase subunit C